MTAQRIAISTLFAILVLAFLGLLAVGIWHETAGTNSYAQLADGWLHGRLDADRCFDGDCAIFNGKTYVIFPPLPGVIALPFVALFGADFHVFMPLAIMAFALSCSLWRRIVKHHGVAGDAATLLILLILFATPLFFVTLRGDRVWFFAQSFGFLFATAALYFALVGRNALLAGLFIGMAFLCRQMSILYLPFLYILLLDEDTPLFRINTAAIKRALLLAAFPALALGVYFIYNYARFGSMMETGYTYMFAEFDLATNSGNFIIRRVRELGIFSDQYFLFNLVYMFIAGPHVQFSGRYLTDLTGFDTNGASLFLVTPSLLFAFLARMDRSFWFGAMTVATIMGVTMFYHSNGFSQYSAQRYALDWLPILLIFLIRGIRPAYAPPLALLTAYSMIVTLSMVVLGGLLTR